MADKIMAQPWTTYMCSQSGRDFIPPQERWVDTSGSIRAVVSLDVSYFTSNGTAFLALETAVDPEGTMGWNTLLTANSTGHYYLIAEANNGASYPLQQLLRWRVDGQNASEWQACFRSTVVLK